MIRIWGNVFCQGRASTWSITLAWWQLLALYWMINNWLPVQLLLTGYFKDCPKDPPWTHEKLFWNRKPVVPPLFQLWLQSEPREAQFQESLQRQTTESHLWWDRGSHPVHLPINQGAVPLVPRLWHWWEFEVPSHFCLPCLLFMLLASFPNKDKGNL